MKSDRRYSAFMFVPGFILIFWLVIFGWSHFEDDAERFESKKHRENVRELQVEEIGEKRISLVTLGAVSEADADGKIELNSASIELLDSLPGIGRQKAEKIVELRTEMNGFRSVEDLLNVEGIGEKLLETIRDMVYVSK